MATLSNLGKPNKKDSEMSDTHDIQQQADINNQTIILDHEIQEYIKEKKELYNNLMAFLENSENCENDFKVLLNTINKQKFDTNREKFDEFLQLISNIGNNHHRSNSLFKKIFQIIQHYQNEISQTFTNFEIYKIFQNNKKILLYLFQNKIVTIDLDIYNEIIAKTEIDGNGYCHFFYPEIKAQIKELDKKLLRFNIDNIDDFEKKRQIGENDAYICSLIREDSVEEFVSYVNRSNIPLKSEICPSVFETNPLLNETAATLIEYAAFFGSIQIFQYLRMNDVELKPSLWIYAVHSQNAELINLLESLKIPPPKKSYKQVLIESIKCHHNQFADYIESNLLQQKEGNSKKSDKVFASIFKFHNYSYFPSNLETEDDFYNLCRYKYNKLMNLYLKKKEESTNDIIKKHFTSADSKSNFDSAQICNGNLTDIVYFLLLRMEKVPKDFLKDNEKISKVIIPSNIKLIQYHAFLNCNSLKKIMITSSETHIDRRAFEDCISLKEITIPCSIPLINIDNYENNYTEIARGNNSSIFKATN